MKNHAIEYHHLLLWILLVFVAGCKTSKEDKLSKYDASWESLIEHETPEWFRDAKFGIYFHWGPYSVPAYKTEWYSHYMYVRDHNIHEYHVFFNDNI